MAKKFKVEVLERKKIDEEIAHILLEVTQPKNLDKWLKTWDVLESTDDMIEAALMIYLIWKRKK